MSRTPAKWYVPEIRFHNFLAPDSGFARRDQKISQDRVLFLAKHRNQAVRSALERYPETKHVLMIDDPYNKFPQEIRKMLDAYDGSFVLGASIWCWARSLILPRVIFYDTWACPGTESIAWYFSPPKKRIGITSVGGCYIFPSFIWERRGYGVPEPFPTAGNEHSYLLADCPIPIYLDFKIRFWRGPSDSDAVRYPWPKRVRCSLGRWRRQILAR